MAQKTINIGSAANDGTGETIRSAFDKTNQNFTEVYTNVDAKLDAGPITGNPDVTMTGPALLGRNAASPGSLQALNKATAKTMLDLDQVDNTADSAKPVSAATQTALNLKMDKNTTTITVSQITGLQTTLDGKLNTSDSIQSASINVSASQRLLGRNASGAGAAEELTATVAKQILGLGNVNNTADADKPLSSLAVTALAGKEPTIEAAATTPQAKYWRGDKTWVNLTKSVVGLSNVDNTADADKPISTATQTALDGKLNVGAEIANNLVTGLSDLLAAKVDKTTNDTALGLKADKTQIVYSVKAYMRNLTPTSVMHLVVDAPFTPNSARSVFKVLSVPNADTHFSVSVNGTQQGTIEVLAGANSGDITWTGSAPLLTAGDLISIAVQDGVDAQGSNTMAMTLVIRN